MIVSLVIVGRISLRYSRYVAQEIAIRWFLEGVSTVFVFVSYSIIVELCNIWDSHVAVV